jgi:ribosomal 50S subunit-recycling heat shock protein
LADGAKQRLDKWLFFARFVKSRTLAGGLAANGHIKINDKASTGADNPVRVGDMLVIRHGSRLIICKVLGLGERRGPATEAQSLYEDLTPTPSDATPVVAQRDAGAGRPEKKERRALERLRASIFDGDTDGRPK